MNRLKSGDITDGSGISGHIGGVAYSPTLAKMDHQYLRTEDSYHVFAAKLSAIGLAIEVIQNNGADYNKYIMYQAAAAELHASRG